MDLKPGETIILTKTKKDEDISLSVKKDPNRKLETQNREERPGKDKNWHSKILYKTERLESIQNKMEDPLLRYDTKPETLQYDTKPEVLGVSKERIPHKIEDYGADLEDEILERCCSNYYNIQTVEETRLG